MSRLTLEELRRLALDELGGQWTTPTQIADRLGLGHGQEWFRVALVLERLANDGMIELRSGTRVRRFRRREWWI